jgi:pimeloyl-ACP methyl ester carboxylesterase
MKRVMSLVLAVLTAIAAFISMRWLFKSREDTDWLAAEKPGKLIEVDGVPLHYIEKGSTRTGGRPPGLPIVMVHGFGGQTFSFRYQVEEFSRDHRCVAIDLKGFGYSGRPEGGDYSLEEQARLVLRAMDQLGIERAILIGHSMGGEVVARAAARAPERVEKLVLVAAPTGYPVWLAPRTPLGKPFMPAFARLARRNARRNLFYDRTAVDFEAIMAEYEKPGRIRGSLNTVWEMWGDVRKQPKLDFSKLTMPILVLWAQRERILAFDQRILRWLRKRLPHAEVVTIPRSGHMLLEEQPEASNNAIRAFIDRETDVMTTAARAVQA